MRSTEYYFYKGAIHIHTIKSDGTADIYKIAKAAKNAGLKWIIITDHNYYDHQEGIINGVYVIKGEEISPPGSNHYLAFGINNQIEPDEDAQKNVNNVRDNGGFGFAAHPDEGVTTDNNGNLMPRKNSHHCIPWTDKEVIPDGIEIWNWFSNWADNLDDSNIFKLAYAYLFKHSIITNPSELTMKWWDSLNNQNTKIIPAIGGVDAHALKFYKYIFPVTVFPYKTCFKTISDIIILNDKLSEDFITAKSQILNAIKQGNLNIINQRVCDDIPNIFVKNSMNTFYPGNSISLDNKCCLYFKSVKQMEVCFIYNGFIQYKLIGNDLKFPIERIGKYRVEVKYNGRGFLYTNPFVINE